MRSIPFLLVLCIVTAVQAQTPKVNDDRLKIELFTQSPDIVTPIGIDVDDKGRVYVIESHTHFPLENYNGPKTDRIRIYEDLDGDHKADRITNFHTGETHTMGISLYRDGSLYVATRKEIFRLRDVNGDGIADERTSLVKLDTKGNYPHNGLSGIAFDFKGDVYFGFGENLGEPYKLIGADNTTLEGGGEGGNIYTCDKDGNKLRRVATGFWNPFHLCFDAFGRLFAVDNDPDSRPPCRLQHIVEGGDYGYRFRYGRKGLHPFTSWNGEIPGTLPMVAGTGEAPSGILAYESDNLPEDYLGDLLVTSWGDHRIERYRLKPNGASFTSKMEPVITGGENFRPVGIALAPDGSLFVSDWVDKSYNVHGKGRVWRISAKEEKKVERPDPVKEAEKAMLSLHRPLRESAARQIAATAEGVKVLSRIAHNVDGKQSVQLRALAAQAIALNGGEAAKGLRSLIRSKEDPALAALAARLSRASWANEPDGMHERDMPVWAEVVRAPMATNKPTKFDHPAFGFILFAFTDPFVSQSVIDGYFSQAYWSEILAKAEWSSNAKLEADSEGLARGSDQRWMSAAAARRNLLLTLKRHTPATAMQFLPIILQSKDEQVRFIAIQWIAESKLDAYRQNLTDSLSRSDLTPRLLVATLTALDMLDGGKPQSADHVGGRWYLERLVFGEKTPATTRAMALRMLPADNPALKAEALTKLLAVEDEAFRIEVVRTLRQSPIKERAAMLIEIVNDEKQAAQVRAEAVAGLDASDDDQMKLLLTLARKMEGIIGTEAERGLRGISLPDSNLSTIVPDAWPKVEDTGEWLKMLEEAATPPAAGAAEIKNGERIFYNAKVGGCYRCHTIGGRGGEAGPDLSTVGKSLTRERLLESILTPSKEIAPRYAAHLVELTDGEKLTLMYVGPSPDGKQIWADTNGKTQLIEPGAIETKTPLKTSIMPTGLHKNLTAAELRDLIVFLESLK